MSQGNQHGEFEKLLHAWELGLLGDAERDRLEEHMINCPECLKAIAGLAPGVDLIASDRDVHALLKDLSARPEEDAAFEASTRPRRVRIPSIRFRWVAAAAVLLIALVLRPWEIRISPDLDVVAAENRLAVAHFEDLSDPDDRTLQGRMLAHLLATDLAESRYVQVVSPRRVNAVYRLLSERTGTVRDRDIALEVGARTHARYVLEGSLSQSEGRTVITGRLVEVPGGRVVDRYEEVGKPSDLFDQVDRLTARVRRSLDLPADSTTDRDPRIADVTTSSQEAYLHYIQGEYYNSQLKRSRAAEEYRRALALDSTFASAWYALYLVEHGDQIDKAVAWSAGASDRERMLILAGKLAAEGKLEEAETRLEDLLERYPDDLEALYSLGAFAYRRNDFEVAADYFRRAVEADSLYRLAYNNLAYCYSYSGRLEEALATLDRYSSIAPEDANPYDSRGDILAFHGRLDDAIQAYRRALEIDPEFTHSRWYLGHMLLFAGRTEEAAAVYRRSARGSDPADRANGRQYLAYPSLFRGRFDEALEHLDAAIAGDRIEQRTSVASKYVIKGTILEELGDLPGAIRQVREGIEAQFGKDTITAGPWSVYLGQLLARVDSLEQAEGVVERLRQIDSRPYREWSCRFVQAEIERARGDFQAALDSFLAAAAVSKDFRTQYALGLAYLEAGDAVRARNEFADLSTIYVSGKAMFGIMDARIDYYTGIACDRTGQYELAREHLAAFLERWKDADPRPAVIDSAAARLESLRGRQGS